MKIGYQLYSARDYCRDAKGLRGTIEKIAGLGYDGVEFFDYCGVPAWELRVILSDFGVEAINAHVPLSKWRTCLEREAVYASEAGIPMLTIPWIDPGERTVETYAEIAAHAGSWVATCAAAGGIRAGYHNHDFEYVPINGVSALDLISEGSSGLCFELDTFWIHYAGFDPVLEMEKRGDRLALIHIKDYTDETASTPRFCAIGCGKMVNGPIVNKAVEMGLEWIVVEQDESDIDVFESAGMSLENARELCGKGTQE